MILVPALSDSMAPFRTNAEYLVGQNQAVVVVSNGPGSGNPGGPLPRLVFGHPSGPATVLDSDGCRGVATMSVRSGTVTWHPD